MPENDSDWKSLYEEMDRFHAMKPWEWMSGDETLIIQMPDGVTDYYCRITGSLGEEYSILAYRGDYGLKSLEKMKIMGLGDEYVDLEQAWFDRDFLAAFLGYESELFESDRKILQRLGLSYEDGQNWPIFRSFSPGFYPYQMDISEIDNCRHVLQQAMILAEEYRDSGYQEEFYEDEKGDFKLVYGRFCTSSQTDEKEIWETRQMRLYDFDVSLSAELLTPQQIQTIQSIKKEMSGSLIIGFGFALNKFRTSPDHRRYHPGVAFFMKDHPRKMLGQVTQVEGENFHVAIVNKTISLMKRYGLPNTFTINHIMTDAAVFQISDLTGIGIYYDDSDPDCMEYIKKHLNRGVL